jgi:hypothetical protein
MSVEVNVYFPTKNLYHIVRAIYKVGRYLYDWTEIDIEKEIDAHREKLEKYGSDIMFDALDYVFCFAPDRKGDRMFMLSIPERNRHMIPDIMTVIMPYVENHSYIQMMYTDVGKIEMYEIEDRVLMWYPCEVVKRLPGEVARLFYFPDGIPDYMSVKEGERIEASSGQENDKK